MLEVALRHSPAPTEDDMARAHAIQSRVDAGESVLMGDRAFARRLLQRKEESAADVITWVQALRIGDLALVSAPGELFVELGMEIKRRSPFGQTIILELANDSIGYIPTRRAFEEGAYEPEASILVSGEGERIVETALDLLAQLRDQR